MSPAACRTATGKLAKTFFFWVVQGLRREYRSLDTVFVAHTTEAWEFNEADFFQVTGTGGTVASTGLAKVREIIDARFNPARCNIYLFYASDGDNSVSDAPAARAQRSTASAADACFTGYVEVSSGTSRQLATETGKLFAELAAGPAAPPGATRSTTSTTCGARCGISSRRKASPRRSGRRPRTDSP